MQEQYDLRESIVVSNGEEIDLKGSRDASFLCQINTKTDKCVMTQKKAHIIYYESFFIRKTRKGGSTNGIRYI